MGMDNLILPLIQAGSMVSTFTYMLARGLDTRKGDLWYLGARPALLLKSLLSVFVIVPLIATAVIILVRPEKATAIGMLLLAASPVAPMALKIILKAGGDREYALDLHFILALLMIVTTPITIELLSILTGFRLEISPEAVAGVVGLSILLPIVSGIIAGRLFPVPTGKMIKPLEIISNFFSMAVNIIVLLFTYKLLFMLNIVSYVAIALMVLGALIAGHLIAKGRPGEQATLALESATGNFGVVLLIVSTFTTLDKALPVIIPYIIISVIICLIYILYMKKKQKAMSRLSPD
jgi:BASS family bile acid:Na+ symporter